ncbi:MAG: phosphoserine phosphatase [Thermoplasmata archaeon]|nr:phosphoserine phosphatase [Thermoplasmata archaeon]
MELAEELVDKREQCNIEAEVHKAARNRLNDQTKHWVEERDKYNAMTRELIEEANQHRTKRDDLNVEVRAAKVERDVWNKKVNEYAERLAKKKREKMPKRGPSVSMLKKKLRALEFQQMTQTLTKAKEDDLIEAMSAAQKEINELEGSIEGDEEVKLIIDESKEARDKAEEAHKLVGELAESAQREHDSMMAIYEKSDALRKQADKAQEEFIKTKMLADEEHRLHIEFIRQVHDFDKIVTGIRQKEGGGVIIDSRDAKDQASDIYDRFKKGEKLSTEDLMLLQQSGYL